MKTSIPATVEAARVTTQVIDMICMKPLGSDAYKYRSPEQIALIVDMVNTAMDQMLNLNVSLVEADAEQKAAESQEARPTIGEIIAEAIARNSCELREVLRRGNVRVVKVKAEDFANERQGN